MDTDPTLVRPYTPLKQTSKRGKGKGKAKAPDPAFEQERKWLIEQMDNGAELVRTSVPPEEVEDDGCEIECQCCFGDYPFVSGTTIFPVMKLTKPSPSPKWCSVQTHTFSVLLVLGSTLRRNWANTIRTSPACMPMAVAYLFPHQNFAESSLTSSCRSTRGSNSRKRSRMRGWKGWKIVLSATGAWSSTSRRNKISFSAAGTRMVVAESSAADCAGNRYAVRRNAGLLLKTSSRTICRNLAKKQTKIRCWTSNISLKKP